VNTHGTAPKNWDTDGDKMPDGYEVKQGTDPNKSSNCQVPLAGGEEYIVRAGDWLTKIADKYLGDPLAYPAIIAATNAKHTEDPTYAILGMGSFDPGAGLEPGQKLWIPSTESAATYLGCQ